MRLIFPALLLTSVIGATSAPVQAMASASANAATAASDIDENQIPSDLRQAVDAIFAPYLSSADEDLSPDFVDKADWDRPLYTAKTSALIKKWRKHMGDEPMDSLSSASWLCICQDWDQSVFRVEWDEYHSFGDRLIGIDFDIRPLGTYKLRLRLLMTKEKGRWLIEDMVSRDMEHGLVAALNKQLGLPPGS